LALRRRKLRQKLEPSRQYRPEYMTAQDVADHPGTSGYLRIERAGVTLSSTIASNIGQSPEGRVTRNGTVTIRPEGEPWAYVKHVAGEGLTLYLPDQWGEYITLLADDPPDRWLPAIPGADPGENSPRGISSSDRPEDEL